MQSLFSEEEKLQSTPLDATPEAEKDDNLYECTTVRFTLETNWFTKTKVVYIYKYAPHNMVGILELSLFLSV